MDGWREGGRERKGGSGLLKDPHLGKKQIQCISAHCIGQWPSLYIIRLEPGSSPPTTSLPMSPPGTAYCSSLV